MTKEQAIEEINKAFEPAFANYIITALTEGATVSDKALEQQPSDDCVSRQAVLDKKVLIELPDGQSFYDIDPEDVESLPPVTPTHGTCKDCRHCCFITGTKNRVCEKHGCMQVSNNWYCADFEKRGNEND